MNALPVSPRDRFISATITLLREGGLSAAGLNEVVALAQAPKGSLYHYFPTGKKQMVCAAIEVYREAVAQKIGQSLTGKATLRYRITRLFKDIEHSMTRAQFCQSCAVGAVVLDLKKGDDELRSSCLNALTHWSEIAGSLLIELPYKQRAAAGRVLVNLLEGAQLAARASSSPRPLREACIFFLEYAHALVAASSKT